MPLSGKIDLNPVCGKLLIIPRYRNKKKEKEEKKRMGKGRRTQEWWFWESTEHELYVLNSFPCHFEPSEVCGQKLSFFSWSFFWSAQSRLSDFCLIFKSHARRTVPPRFDSYTSITLFFLWSRLCQLRIPRKSAGLALFWNFYSRKTGFFTCPRKAKKKKIIIIKEKENHQLNASKFVPSIKKKEWEVWRLMNGDIFCTYVLYLVFWEP